MRIKIITGFRPDQEYSVSMEEAHKAYYLFYNPEARAVFADGLAITGKVIQAIEPDYQGTMGWNPTHRLDSDDWNELRDRGVDLKVRNRMYIAKLVAQEITPEELRQPLSTLIEQKGIVEVSYSRGYPQLSENTPSPSQN